MTADGIDRSFGAPRFDVVLRGYDRRQVDEHIARLQRVLSRMRSDLESVRRRQMAVPPLVGPPPPPGARPRPSPRPRPDALLPVGDGNDVVGTFTERMNAILQAAEEEAAEIRGKAESAQAAARVEQETMRTALADLARQRDAVLADLTRVRGQLEGMLSMPTTVITLPPTATDTPEPDSDTGQPLPGISEPSESATVPDDEAVDEPVEDPSAEAPGRVRFAGSTVRYPAPPPVAEEPEPPFDLFRPASEDRRAPAPAVEQSPDGSPAERTAVLRPVVRVPETSAEAPEPDEIAAEDDIVDEPADSSTAEPEADADADDTQAAPVRSALRFG